MTQAAPEAPAGAPPIRYFAIHDSLGDDRVMHLVRVNNGIFEWWTGGEGEEEWVDTPHFASYFGPGGDPGARMIEEAEAETIKGQVTPPPPGVVFMMRGDGKGSSAGAAAPAAEAPAGEPEEPAEEPPAGDQPPVEEDAREDDE